MLNFTKQERLVLMFIGFASLLGIAANLSLKKSCPLRKVYQSVYEETPFLRIDINQATNQQLVELPGIGEILAQRIIDYRNQNGPFKKIEDLQSIKGISPRLFQKIKDRLFIQP